MAFKTPVLLIAYRRPDTTKQVIDAIRVAAPERMFVACDGPNPKNPGEAERVAATRALIEREIDWPCKIERRYSDTNQGCKMGPSSAITWFFEQVEEGIILEDDCVAHPDFFPYCEALLERYNNDRRVWCISGDNSAAINLTGDWSYGFIHTPLVWGWASWRRAWANYDIQMNVWNKIKNTPILQDIFPDPLEREVYLTIFEQVSKKGLDAWDYQFVCASILNDALCAIPARNLISNIGFEEYAVHTTNINPRSYAPSYPILPLEHPPLVWLDRHADSQVFDKVHGGAGIRESRQPINRIKRSIPMIPCRLLYFLRKLLTIRRPSA
jgi:hypothetical protein